MILQELRIVAGIFCSEYECADNINFLNQVIGNDLSANMPTFVPPNVKFEVDDVESPWAHDAKFSWIFSRYMAGSIFDWPSLVGNIYECVASMPRVYEMGS
jgi:hypothetical protein